MLSNGIIFSLLGLVIGFVLSDIFDSGNVSVLVGIVGGFLTGAVITLFNNQTELKNSIRQLELKLMAKDVTPEKPVSKETLKTNSDSQPLATPPPAKVVVTEAPLKATVTPPTQTPTPSISTGTSFTKNREARAVEDTMLDKLTSYIHSFFTEGNVLVKIGLIILFFGIAFLLKYASDHSMLPIELRLAGVSLGGIALLVIGWQLRNKKELYALLLQGGGIGVMYLTIYAASKLYALLPHGFSFSLMLLLVILSSILAILQNAKALAQYGAAGGFLAPILLSTGTGSHVMLFSYYLLLNIGILTIAWFYSWRSLNLLGFLFTFIIGTTWGAFSYTPDDFNSVEPFLVIFFILFTMISILFATRQPPELKGYVDSTLVFGLPVIVFALQAAMVERFEYGLALSAFAMSAFYILLTSILWKRQGEGLRLLCEAFLATGVIFGSLTIPLALDSQWSSAAWSLEGVGLLWVGLRQQRLLARCFGILLLLGGGILFFDDFSCSSNIVVLNTCFIGAFIISVSALLSSYLMTQYTDIIKSWEITISSILFAWGFIWWYLNGFNEISVYSSNIDLPVWLLAFATITMLGQFILARKLDWQQMFLPLHLLLPFMWVVFLLSFIDTGHPFTSYNWLGWLIAFAGQYYLLNKMDKSPNIKGIHLLHMASFWLLILIGSVEITWHVSQAIPESQLWAKLSWILLASLVIYSISNFSKLISWPVQAHSELYMSKANLPVVMILYLSITVMGIIDAGSPDPLGYIPFLNPLDICIALTLIVLFNWHHQLNKLDNKISNLIDTNIRLKLLALSVFLWLTGIVARTVHYWSGVSYTQRALFESDVFQTSISVFWTLLALSITVFATKRSNRYVWFAGASLMGVVIAKLFLVDLANTGTVEQIISFVAVGILMLVIGYFSPLPPHKEQTS